MSNLPFKEIWISPDKSIREFSSNSDDEEFKWHFDNEDRIIECEDPNDWKFQFDNLLPQDIKGEILIPSGTWHRLIKGSGDIKILITRLGK